MGLGSFQAFGPHISTQEEAKVNKSKEVGKSGSSTPLPSEGVIKGQINFCPESSSSPMSLRTIGN